MSNLLNLLSFESNAKEDICISNKKINVKFILKTNVSILNYKHLFYFKTQ